MKWWELGERPDGQYGGMIFERTADRVVCPYCSIKGGFVPALNLRQEGSYKTCGARVFAVFKCTSCANCIFLLGRFDGHHRTIIDFMVAPDPKPDPTAIVCPKGWPAPVGDAWAQAKRSLTTESWDAAATMARRSVQAALRQQGAEGKHLNQEINSLVVSGALTKLIGEWAHEIRGLGNVGAHPDGEDVPITPVDAKQATDFAYYLGHYLYTLPKEIQELRERRAKEPEGC